MGKSIDKPFPVRLGELKPLIQKEAFNNERSAHYWIRKILKKYYDMHLIVGKRHTLKGKDVYEIDLQENNLPTLYPEIHSKLFGKLVTIDGNIFKVCGIEKFAIPLESNHKSIVIMVEPA